MSYVLCPNAAYIYNAIGLLHNLQGNLDSAIHYLQKSRDLAVHWFEPRGNIVKAHYQAENFNALVEETMKLYADYPNKDKTVQLFDELVVVSKNEGNAQKLLSASKSFSDQAILGEMIAYSRQENELSALSGFLEEVSQIPSSIKLKNWIEEGMNNGFFPENTDLESLSKAVQFKIKDLINYLELITGKYAETAYAQDAVDYALKLFIDERRTVQLASKGKRAELLHIREFLERLRLLNPYSDIEIDWFEIYCIKEIRRGGNGLFWGQTFANYRYFYGTEGSSKYANSTMKTIEPSIAIKSYKESDIMILLGDISVIVK